MIAREASIMRRIEEAGDIIIATSVVVQGELLFMAEKSERVYDNLIEVRGLLETIRIYDIDGPVAEVYGTLKSNLIKHFGPKSKLARRRITLANLGFSDNDLWIAATAIRHNLTLVSSDTDFTRMADAHPFAIEAW